MARSRVLGLFVALGLAGTAVAALGAQSLTLQQKKEMIAAGKLCTLPGDKAYSTGAQVAVENRKYRCMPIFGENLTPAGSAWVEVESQIVTVLKDPR